MAAFGEDDDLGTVIKQFSGQNSGRYTRPICIGCEKNVAIGEPHRRHISTSYVERSNLPLRMSMRQFIRLTNSFSKKIENHVAAVALHSTPYNFSRIHKTLRVTSVMALGIADHVWSTEEIMALLA